MSDPRPLHRLFGLSWIDFFQGTAVTVETEIDLSVKQQFLDLVIIRKGMEPIVRSLPDGFEDLAAHNLLTFKSYQEALDGWTLCELVGHYVNYRKQTSPSMQNLLAESQQFPQRHKLHKNKHRQLEVFVNSARLLYFCLCVQTWREHYVIY